jgi:glycosyltransferase involved in cell wall biosynthesis
MAAAVDQYLVKKASFDPMFSFLRAKAQVLSMDSDYEVLHLHWIPGALSLKGLHAIAKKSERIFLTAHDLRPATGGCHYALSCEGFKSGCSSCPAVMKPFTGPVRSVAIRQKETFDEINVKLIVPSEWMAKMCRESWITGGLESKVIENPIEPSFFQLPRHKTAPPSTLRVGIVAANLVDPIKGIVPFLDELLRRIDKDSNLTVRLIGSNGKALGNLDPRITWLGSYAGEDLIRQIDQLDCLVIPSVAEAAGNVIAEASARGVPSLGVSGSGISDMISNKNNGYKFESLVDLVHFVLRTDVAGQVRGLAARSAAEAQRWNPSIAARRHLDYYSFDKPS